MDLWRLDFHLCANCDVKLYHSVIGLCKVTILGLICANLGLIFFGLLVDVIMVFLDVYI